jgi:hypothetical protein
MSEQCPKTRGHHDGYSFFVGTSLGLMAMGLTLIVTDCAGGERKIHEGAIKAGAGHWTIDPEGKRAEFVWTPAKPELPR